MSQAGSFFDGTINSDVETLTADSGGPVGPDSSFNINVLGGNNITTVGNAGTNTITIDLDGTIADTYVTDSGSATPVAGVINVLGGENLNTTGAGDVVTIDLDRGTDGQLLIAATGAPTAYANVTSADGSVVITEGPNSIDLSASAMSGVLTLTGDSGGAVSPDGAGDLDLLGGTSITTTGNPGSNSITFAVDGDVATQYDTDAGTATPAGNVLNVLGGDNMNTAGAGMNLNIHLNETIHWPDTNATGTTGVIFLGGSGGVGGTRFMHNFGTNNTFLGEGAGNFTLTVAQSIQNVGIGRNALSAITTAEKSVAIGDLAGSDITTGMANVAIGRSSMRFNTGGEFNISIGWATLLNMDNADNNTANGTSAGINISTGSENTFLGRGAGGNGDSSAPSGITTGNGNLILGGGRTLFDPAGSHYTSSESENILLANSGVVGESNTIRIGGAFADDPTQNRCFIQGIYGVNPAVNDEEMALIDSSGQLGTITQTDGEVLIGSTGSTPVAATLTAGDGVNITNGSGAITVDAVGGGLTWNVETTASVTMSVNNGYIANRSGAQVDLTLPDTAPVGSIIRVTGIDNATGWRISQNAGETIHFGTSSTTTGAGGFLESTATRDSVELVCVVADTDWNVLSSLGNPSVN